MSNQVGRSPKRVGNPLPLALASLLAALFALSGCLLVYDPLGADASVRGSWTVNGTSPSASTCAAAGIDTVRLGFYDAGSPFYYDTLMAPCSGGTLTSAGPVLAAGTYEVAWEAFLNGQRVAQGPRQFITATVGGTIVVPTVDFQSSGSFNPMGSDSYVSGSWTVNNGPATSASCGSAGIDRVRLGFYNQGSPVYYDAFDLACSAGSFTTATPVLRAGTYEVAWEAYSGTNRIGMGPRQTIVATSGGTVVIPAVNFATAGGFNPIGTDARVRASWTINGQLPSSATCSSLTISRVRVAFFDGSSSSPFEYAALVAPCAQGSMETTPVLRAGTYTVQFQALDASDTIIGTGAMETIVATSGGLVTLNGGAPVNFIGGSSGTPDVTVAAMWLLNGQMPTTNSCYAVGIENVRVNVYASTDTGLTNPTTVAMAPCAGGSLDTLNTPAIYAGTYILELEAVDENGAQVITSVFSTPTTAPSGSRLELPRVDYQFGNYLTLGLDWQASTGSTTTCTGAGVQTMNITLRNGASVVAQRSGVPCQDLVAWDAMSTPSLSSGSYNLDVTGFTGGLQRWRTSNTSCQTIFLPNNGIVYDRCLIAYTP